MCHVKVTGKYVCGVMLCLCKTHVCPVRNSQPLYQNCVLMKYGESSFSENGVECLKIVEHSFLVITALDTNAARVEEVIWKIDG